MMLNIRTHTHCDSSDENVRANNVGNEIGKENVEKYVIKIGSTVYQKAACDR